MQKLLLPNKFKKIGWIILVPSIIFGVILMVTDFEFLKINLPVFAFFSGGIFESTKPFSFIQTNITNTIAGVCFIVGAMFVSFSKEKNEDEYISELRLSSLLWAVFVNYILLIIAFLFIYGTAFLTIMLYNMFTVLIIFIVRFNYVLYRNSKGISNEE